MIWTRRGAGSRLAGGTVGNLRCEYLEKPQGIDVLAPRLSWMLSPDGNVVRREKPRYFVFNDAFEVNNYIEEYNR